MKMFGILKKLVRPKFAILLGAVVLGWQGWAWYKGESSQRPAMDELRSEAADEYCMKLAENLPQEMAGKTVLVCDMADDSNGYITWSLNEALKTTGRFKVVPAGIMDRVRKELKISAQPPETKDEAVKQGKAASADYVIYGKIEKFGYADRTVTLKCSLNVVKVQNAAVIANVADEYSKRELDFTGLPLWAAFVALFPLLCLRIIKRIVRSESNFKTAAGLVGFISVDWVVLAFAIKWNFSMAAVSLQILLVLLAAGYNYWIFLKAEQSRLDSLIL